MCSDPTHTKEFKEIAESMVRMETKLDHVLSAVGDHEVRIRMAESALLAQKENKKDHASLRNDVDALQDMATSMAQTLEYWKKVLWTIAAASFTGLGVAIWDGIKRVAG